ncbi:hypothetical protein SALBM135S_08427 [Streptomyces alboniger]
MAVRLVGMTVEALREAGRPTRVVVTASLVAPPTHRHADH